jgi:hypothetical protein
MSAHTAGCHCDECFEETCDFCGEWGRVTQTNEGRFKCAACALDDDGSAGHPERVAAGTSDA